MRLVNTSNVSPAVLSQINFDLVIVASGYESRARYLAEQYAIEASSKLALQFLEHSNDAVRMENDIFFQSNGFSFTQISGNKAQVVGEILLSFLSSDFKNEINILVDYSSMSRVWYAEIIRILRDYSPTADCSVNVFFSYSFSEFIEPPDEMIFNRYVGPIPGFYSISVPSRPSALIIGLGYIESRAFGLAEYFDVDPILFLGESSTRQEFFDKVVANNRRLIDAVDVKNIYYFPVNNLVYTETLLNHLCRDLISKFRVVIAPCGPKPFTLLSLLTSLRLNDVDVWRISAGEHDVPVDKKANGEVNVFRTVFTNTLSS
ncbi:MAG: hypothetical protein E6Q24_04675 [Chitinophagaceae bacterium]|nr:MAG: hypothetical protein E6Q24_04675 [Chitinophagaceae bacterium]